MQSSIPKTLAFRYLYVSSVVKEDVVTVFGQQGSEFQLGTDYDAMVTYEIPSSELSNLVTFYNGGILNGQQVLPNGLVGSSDIASQLSTSGAVTSIEYYNTGYSGTVLNSPASGKASQGQYHLGDVVLFDPKSVGATFSSNASCWTCIRSTSTPSDPLPLYGSVPPPQINRDALPGSTGAFAGFYGQDINQQNFITGVLPAYYTYPGQTLAVNPDIYPSATLVTRSTYWQESQIAQFYDTRQIYYAGELVVFGGAMYECISTQGDKAVPSLYLNPAPANATAIIAAAGTLLAPNGAYGYDFSGQRYIQSVPPSGGLFSALFWQPSSQSNVPTSVFALVNWDNLSIHNKLTLYDATVTGGSGAQTLATFTDDIGVNNQTLGQIYSNNEAGFSLVAANAILARLPAAAIKSTQAGTKPTPDSSLVEMVHAGPTQTKPSGYAPSIQGVFEEAIYRDMLEVDGTPTAIQNFVVAQGSQGYFQDGTTGRPQLTFTNIVGGSQALATNPSNVPLAMDTHAYVRCGLDSVFVDKTKASYASDTSVYVVGDVLSIVHGASGSTEPMYFITATALVEGVDSNGKILTVSITNPGDGYLGLPDITIPRISSIVSQYSYLVPVMKVTSIQTEYDHTAPTDDTWGFLDGVTYAVQYGSGSGAIASAKMITGTPPVSYTNSVSFLFDGTAGSTAGSGYVVSNYVKDIIKIYDPATPSVYLPAEVETINPSGGITSIKLLKQGCGYLKAPILNISAAGIDPEAIATIDPTVGYSDAGLIPLVKTGKYRPGYLNETYPSVYTSAIASTYGSLNPYLGIKTVNVVAGGQGYQVNDPVVFRDSSGAELPIVSMTPSLGSTGGTFTYDNLGGRTLPTMNILNGGSGYKVGSNIILDGPPGTTGQIVCKVTNTGGNVTSLGFSSANLVGVSFSVGDFINLGLTALSYTNIQGDALVATVKQVGPYGQLWSPSLVNGSTFSDKYSNDVSGTTYVYLGSEGITGSQYGSVVYAKEVFNGLQSVIVSATATFYDAIPTLKVSDPDYIDVYDGVTFPAFATAATVLPQMSLLNITITGFDYSSGFVNGDVFYANQTGALPATLTVLSTQGNGSVSALGIEHAGSGFDPAQPFTYTYNSSGGTFTSGFVLTPQLTIGSVTVTDPGWGYTTNPTITLSGATITGQQQTFTPNMGKRGGGAAFIMSTFNSTDANGVHLKLYSRGSGYIPGEMLAIVGPTPTSGSAASGLYTFVDTTVGGNILAADVGVTHGTMYNVGTYTSVLDPTLTNNQPPGYGGSNPGLPLTYSVLTTGDPTSISGVTVLESISSYSAGSGFSHKKLPQVSVGSVDSKGAITSFQYTDPGYGFISLPTASVISTAGLAASLDVPYLGMSRIEDTFLQQSENFFNSDTVTITSPNPPSAATAYATISGDLYPISVDGLKNPNLLANLETLKPGSTTCYGQGKASMSLASSQGVLIMHSGSNLGNYSSLGISIGAPTGKNGVQATAIVDPNTYDPVKGVLSVTVTNVGAGYLDSPVITLTYSGVAPSDLPVFKAQMVVTGVEVTGRGLGYNPGIPPLVTFADSDVTPGTRATGKVTLKSSVTSLSVQQSGALYTSVPQVTVVSEGTGGLGYVRMGVSDIEVLNGGNGFLVGDVLTFGLFGTTGGQTYTYDTATLISDTSNAPPPSDNVLNPATGLTFATKAIYATVSAVTGPTNSIQSLVINNNPYIGITGIYGEPERSLALNNFHEYGGVGYGIPTYVDNSGMTWTTVESMPRVTGFYRPSLDPLVQGYFTAGATLQNGFIPWINTDNTANTGATFGSGITYLTPLTYAAPGQGLTAMLLGNLVEQPTIACRLGVSDFVLDVASPGTNFVCDANVLIETPPPSQQAQYQSIVSGGQVSGFTQITSGDGYITIPNVSINGGGGNGAVASANLGVSKITIIDGGTGSNIGDLITIANPNGTIATGIVTLVDAGLLSTGKNAILYPNFTNGIDLTTNYGWSYAGGTGTVSGGGVTGTLLVRDEGYGYEVGDIYSALPVVDPLLNSIVDISAENKIEVTSVPGTADPLLEHMTFYAVSETGDQNVWPLGAIISVRPKVEGTLPTGASSGLRAILLVNTIFRNADTNQIYSLYDDSGALLDTGPYSYKNAPNERNRTGYTMPLGVKDELGSGAIALVNFIFLGWSDGTHGNDRTYGTTDGSVTQWFRTSGYWDVSLTTNITRTPAQFQIQAINDQQNGILSVNVIVPGTGAFFDCAYNLPPKSKGTISAIQITSPGSGFISLPDPSHIISSSGFGAILVPSLSVTSLTIGSGGTNYVASPIVQIDAPSFRSLKPQLYSRSAELMDLTYTATTPPGGGTLQLLAPGVGYLAGGVYKLVVDNTVGGLHQEGNASNSLDSYIVLGGVGFWYDVPPASLTLLNPLVPDTRQTGTVGVNTLVTAITSGAAGLYSSGFKSAPTSGTLLENSVYIQKGSNYRVGEVYTLVAYGTTPPPSSLASVKILPGGVTSSLDYNRSPAPGINTGTGILDAGLIQNGQDVGGYGTGYINIPKIRIVGGSQGLVASPTLGLAGVGFANSNRGTNYNVNDQVWALFKEYGPQQVGIVSTILNDVNGTGQIGTITLFSPQKSGITFLPTLSVVRLGGVIPGSVDASLVPSLGVVASQLTNTTDGFIGQAFVEVDSPNGAGYPFSQQDAIILANSVEMIDTINVDSNSSLVLYQTPPLISIDQPPFVHTYSGWNGLYFAPGDAFDFVVQYTIAKAVAFQVDSDVTLTGPYQVASSITIGGVTIPLRAPGPSNSQGRELSANKVVYRYLVKLLAV